MKIVVCVKQVPDTEAQIKVKPSGNEIEGDGIKFTISPYDEFALEEALKLKEATSGEVTLVTLGPSRATEVLRHGQALGVNRAIHLVDAAFDGGDVGTTAKALAAAIKALVPDFDMIWTGWKASDDDQAQVGVAIAERLGVPHVAMVTKFALEGRTAVAHRAVEGATEVVECPLPAVFTAQKGLNDPRYPTLKGIMGAKKMSIEEQTLAATGLSAGDVGAAGATLKVTSMAPPPPRSAGKPLEGEDAPVMAKKLADALRAAKVI